MAGLAELAESWSSWVVFGLVLGAIEIFAPGFIFIGFAIGAVLTGLLIRIGLDIGLAPLLLLFACLSLLAWGLVRRLAGKREGQVKLWDKDINDNP